jgi:hypothetical protein
VLDKIYWIEERGKRKEERGKRKEESKMLVVGDFKTVYLPFPLDL